MIRVAVVALVLLAGCAGPAVFRCWDGGKAPFASERYLPMSGYPLEDQTALTVHNPLDVPVVVHVHCNPSLPFGSLDKYAKGWSTCLPARTDKAVLVEFLPQDSTHQVCWVDHWVAKPASSCVSNDRVY